MICNFTGGIIYGSSVDDVLNCIEEITDRIKRVIFFLTSYSFYKVIGKFMNNGLIDKQKIIDKFFFNNYFLFMILSVN
jgi:hypothetical protein